jgi:hypothetical protein
MEKKNQSDLPQVAVEYIDSVIKHMKYRKKIRADVREELIAHFTDALADCETNEKKQRVAEELIAEFGDVKLLGKLMRRAKKRCRPLWQQTTFAVLKIIGLLFLLLLLRVGYMATGRPTISVDYTQWMNDKVCNGRDESLNAYHDYQKAIELLPEKTPPIVEKLFHYTIDQQLTSEDWQEIEVLLETESEIFKTFRAGAAKPYYWNIYQSPKDHKGQLSAGVIESLMPQMTGYKKIVRRMSMFQIPYDIYKGRTHQAVDDCIALYRFARHLLAQGVVIEQLVGVAIEAVARGSVSELLSQSDLPAENLLRLQLLIEEGYNPGAVPMDWSLEKAFWYDEIQRSFTDDGQGNGRPLLRGTLFAVNDKTDYLTGLITGFPSRKEVIDNINKAYERFDEYRQLKPETLSEMETLNSLEVDKLMFMQQISEPAIRKTMEIGWRSRASQAGLIGTLAILRFEKENRRLPENWIELYERGYLKTIPMDPYSDKPLVYKKTEDGFILYSVGLNFIDDGGIPGTGRDGKARMWADNGDQIFWPVTDHR